MHQGPALVGIARILNEILSRKEPAISIFDRLKFALSEPHETIGDARSLIEIHASYKLDGIKLGHTEMGLQDTFSNLASLYKWKLSSSLDRNKFANEIKEYANEMVQDARKLIPIISDISDGQIVIKKIPSWTSLESEKKKAEALLPQLKYVVAELMENIDTILTAWRNGVESNAHARS